MLVDRFVHLLSRGCVIPVVRYFANCLAGERGCGCGQAADRVDVSEVLEVLEVLGDDLPRSGTLLGAAKSAPRRPVLVTGILY